MGRGQKKHTEKVAEEAGYNYRKNKTDERNTRKAFNKQKARDRAMAADEEFQFSKQLHSIDLRIKYITGDGNCLFRSIADQLEGNPTIHRQYRDRIVNYIVENGNFFSNFIEDDEDFDCYIARMRTDCEWGGHQELYAASQLLVSDIIVHQFQSPRLVIRSSQQPCSHTIHLSYHGEMHYNSVRNKSDSDSGPPTTIVLSSQSPSSLPLSDDDIFMILRSIPGAKSSHLTAAVNYLVHHEQEVNAWNMIDVLLEQDMDSLCIVETAVVADNKAETNPPTQPQQVNDDDDDSNKRVSRVSQQKPKRKENCPCGSGKQYYQCCRNDNKQPEKKSDEVEPKQRKKPRHKSVADDKKAPTEIEL